MQLRKGSCECDTNAYRRTERGSLREKHTAEKNAA